MKKSVLSPRWSCLSRSFDICKNRQTKTALPSHKQMEGISRLFRSGQVPLKSLHKHQISSVAILRVHKPKSLCVKPWSLMNVSVGPVWVESHPWGGSESVHVGAARSFFSRPLTSIPSALQHQRLDRPNCPICGLIYTEILISSDAQRALNNARTHPQSRICLHRTPHGVSRVYITTEVIYIGRFRSTT